MSATYTLEELRDARRKVAKYAVANPALLPVFDRLDREVEELETRAKVLSRAELIAAGG